jgi:hypothetical protein
MKTRLLSAKSALAISVVAIGLTASSARASTVYVSNFGDGGWKSDDTRDATGVDLVGTNNTHAGDPAVVPSAAHDTAIANQIKFVAGPAGSTYGGAVSIDGTSGNSGKSNFSVINPATGFDAASNLLTTFNATYQWYGQPNPTTRTLAFKLGIQSTEWGTGAGESQNGFTAQRSGESVWDLVLVHVPATSDNAWSTVSVDHDSGTWNLFRQAGNAFFPVPSATAQTLDAWALDPTFGNALFGPGAKVTSVQFGLGSGQRQSIGYVDYLQTNLLNDGDLIDFQAAGFVAPVPLPSAALGGLALCGGIAARRTSRRRPPIA